MTEKILFVDDEPAILHSMQRQLHKRFNIQIATSGDEALRILKEDGPFAVIVSDMRMPNMDGIRLLKMAKNLYPDTVRILLTGYADQQTAIEAVNNGQVFRFLVKPCSPGLLIISLVLAIKQYHLITAEQDLLQKTLKGCVSVLSELLSMTNPLAFSSSLRIREYMMHLVDVLQLPNPWQYEIAALLAQIGCVTLPGEILSKFYVGQKLTAKETELFDGHPETAQKLLQQIPRMEQVTSMIACQQKPFSAYADEPAESMPKEIVLGAQILKAVIDYDRLLFQGKDCKTSLALMHKQKKVYNPVVLAALAGVRTTPHEQVLSLKVDQINVGMVAEDDVLATNGSLIVAKGQIITAPLLKGLTNFSRQIGVVEPIRIRLSILASNETPVAELQTEGADVESLLPAQRPPGTSRLLKK